MKEKLYKTDYEEQETVINIDYCKKNLWIYTCRNAVYKRIVNSIGDPTKKYYTDGKTSGASWIISFEDRKKITKLLSRPLLIGNMK